jgi:hypothetical protein
MVEEKVGREGKDLRECERMKSGRRQAARKKAVTRKQEKSQWEGWNLMLMVGAQAYMIPRTGKMRRGFCLWVRSSGQGTLHA